MAIEPLKPFRGVKSFVGTYDDAFVAFVPEEAPAHADVANRKEFECTDHVVSGSRYLTPGKPIVAIRFRSGDIKKRWNVRMYCSVICQRHDAVSYRTSKRAAVDDDE